ncbi:recombinase family protein [Dinghuibacter silviterrae]|uniref:DNA invertase Pin-like site-specific DNA recombinase n=1 Tax=Dinghuibacter silviterrae TaxID=1539049 RepID=A0A4R8DIZ1_9BACT|nr:recombinase family protein [Dinghuibacter silviterrae]TDW97146.1 DNA invertase Pin-like site-specific DNA recombinase [Dinghuibacter silviterrae]
MKKAIIYVRVSTDEQSEKGYSLQHQEDRLRQYCQQQQIDIIGFYKEDHSAKTFERPAFNELLKFLKTKRGNVDLLLFLKWDRFSRNAADAYSMISQLTKLGVEPQAIEQPLDLNIPENKIMLAFYLAAPEVENDRRSLNVIAGMRRAMKDGRHVTMAPKGYKNARNEQNRPIIVPSKDAPMVKWVFEEVAKGVLSIKEVWRTARRKGLNVGRSNIWYLLRNPIYYGKILLPAYKDEETKIISGLHEPIISEDLFYEVQDVLDGKKRNPKPKYTAREELPLRGFLQCPRCGRALTGSPSRGNGGTYFYYHCTNGCKERVKAEEVNKCFTKELARITIKDKYITLFEKAAEHYYHQNQERKSEKEVQTEIDKHLQRIKKAQQLLLDGELSAAEYKEIKSQYEPEIAQLERKRQDIEQMDANLLEYVKGTADLLRNLLRYYNNATLPVKQKLIGSIYPKKLIYEKNEFRTTEVNEVIAAIRRLGAAEEKREKEKAPETGGQSEEVIRIGSIQSL